MKLQLKRSNVLLDGNAKPPSVEQMEYGELAVNYNQSDPVLFIKDSSDNIIRLTNNIEIGNGQINVDGGNGIVASGSNALANQSANTSRVISIDETWLNDFNNNNGNGAINVNAGSGLQASGSNASANQSSDTTRILSIKIDSGKGLTVSGAGVRVQPSELAGTGLEVEGDKLRVTPTSIISGDGIVIDGDTITVDVSEFINENKGLAVENNKIVVDLNDGLEFNSGGVAVTCDPGYGLQTTPTGLRIGGPWTNIPVLTE